MNFALTRWLGLALLIAWPLAVFLLHGSVGSWPLLAVGGLLLIWRLPQARVLALIAALGLIALGVFSRAELGMRAYPVAVSAVMLCLFLGSLMHGMPMIERLARLQEPDLPPAGVVYTRRVTWAWCLFFLLNGSIAAWTALSADLATWALYNGVISYCLMGLMFAGEWVCRRHMRKAAA